MAVSVNWAQTQIIYVPKADLTLVQAGPPEIYSLNTDAFRLTLRDLEDDLDGRPWPKTHVHETESVLSGVTYARKFRILPPYTVTFEEGQYRVLLLGSNNNLIDVANVNQVSIVPNNSGGLIVVDGGGGSSAEEIWRAQLATYATTPGSTAEAVMHVLYDSKVCLDPINGVAGTGPLVGTRNTPSNNWPDAKTIAEALGYVRIEALTSVTLTAADVISDFTFCGLNAVDVVVTVEDGCTTQNAAFENIVLEGAMTGKITIRHCQVFELDKFQGYAFDSLFMDNISVQASAKTSRMFDCRSGGVIELDIGANGLVLVGWSGPMKLVNKTGVSPTVISLTSGYVEIDSTCVAGVIIVNGEGRMGPDDSGPSCIVDSSDLLTAVTLHGQVDKIDLEPTIGPAAAESGSLLDRIANKDSNKTFNQATDSLEGIRGRIDGS